MIKRIVVLMISVGLHALLDGDVDFDGLVGLDDWDTFRSNFGSAGTDWTEGNFDPWSDITVDLDDWDAFRSNFGNAVPAAGSAVMNVPEPGTLAMLLAGLAGGWLAQWQRRPAGGRGEGRRHGGREAAARFLG